MNIFVSGISGTAMGALALFAKNAGMGVVGSDLHEGAVTKELRKAKIPHMIGKQDGAFLKEQYDAGNVDWFVYTSALPKDHPELMMAKKLGLKVSKRDELIEELRKTLDLKMVAVAGTHGKTTTTSMIIWTCKKLEIPVSYLVGSTLPFGAAGKFEKGAKFLIYEADEYDRNFLYYHPWLSVITVVDYDHPDIYPTEADYKNAFTQFIRQSKQTILKANVDKKLKLAGEVRRIDASLAKEAILRIAKEAKVKVANEKIIDILNDFPGVGRRFERIANGVYSDYGHHPAEIAATVEMALEEAKRLNKSGVVVIYEPHQNIRQHEICKDYKNCFSGAEKLYWLPTYLVREDPNLPILTPDDLIGFLSNKEIAESAKMNKNLEKTLLELQKENKLIVLMTAGPADVWFRKLFGNS